MPPELENNEEKNKIELRVACLRGLREHVGLLQRLSADPKHLDQILVSSPKFSFKNQCGIEGKKTTHEHSVGQWGPAGLTPYIRKTIMALVVLVVHPFTA